MSYRVPLATATLPGSVLPGDGLRVVDGVVSTGGFAAEASVPQVTVESDGVVQVDAMTLTPGAGTYRVLFNMNYRIEPVAGDITLIAAAEVDTLYTNRYQQKSNDIFSIKGALKCLII